jgi:AcrR family transcriptional regulator
MKSEKKEKIFKAALNMIKKTGVHSLAMGQLSRDSGIAAGTFYHYFSSKDMMLQETFLYCHKRAAAVGAKAVKGDENYKTRFSNLCKAWYDHFSKSTTELFFIQESEAGYSVPSNTIRESRVFYNEVFSFLNTGEDKNALRDIDAKLKMQVIIQSIYAAIKYEIIFENKLTSQELDQLVEICWHGLKERDKKGS